MKGITAPRRSRDSGMRTAPKPPPPFRRKLLFEALEPRILLSAAPGTEALLLIPGFGATQAASAALVDEWLTTRGIAPDKLQIDPLSNSAGDLIQSLENIGYSTDAADWTGADAKTPLIIANWDWRVRVAESDAGPADGTLSGVTAASMTDWAVNGFDTSLDYLGYYLKQAADAGFGSVDIVTHSTGGLVARAYMQSAAYGQDGLPTVDDLILVGVPSEGVGQSWNMLLDDFNVKPASRGMAHILDLAWKKMQAGEAISGPDGDITLADLHDDPGTPQNEAYIEFEQRYIGAGHDLVGTYDLVDYDGDGAFSVVTPGDPDGLANTLLLDLNAGSGPLNMVNRGGPGADGKTVIVYGEEIDTLGQLVRREGFTPDAGLQNELLGLGQVIGHLPASGQAWYQETNIAGRGDGTVPAISAKGPFDDLGSDRVILKPISKAAAGEDKEIDHVGLLVNKYAQKQILNEITTGEASDAQISQGKYYTTAQQLSAIVGLGLIEPREFVLDALDDVGRLLDGVTGSGALNTDLPFVGVSVMDVLPFMSSFRNAVQTARDAVFEYATLEELNDYLAQQLGADFSLSFAFDNGQFTVNLGYHPSTSTNVSFEVAGNDFDAELEVGFNLDVAIGVDLTTPDAGNDMVFMRVDELSATARIQDEDLDIEVHLGDLTAAIVDGSVSLAATLGLGLVDPNNDHKLTITELLDGFRHPTTFIDPTLTGTLDVLLPFDASIGGFDFGDYGTPTVEIHDDDIFDGAAPEVTADIYLDGEGVRDNILAFLANPLGGLAFLDQPIPLVGESLNDLLGVAVDDILDLDGIAGEYFDSFEAGGVNAGARPTATGLIDWLGQGISQRAAAAAADIGTLTLTGGFDLAAKKLFFDLDLDASYVHSEQLAFSAADLGLDSLLPGIDLSELVTLRGNALVDFSATADLHVGFDLDFADGVDFSFDDDTGFSAQVTGSADDLDFQLGIAGFGMVIEDGVVLLDLSASADLDGAEVHGSAGVDLPLYFPIKTMPVGGTTADEDGDGFGDNVLHALAGFSVGTDSGLDTHVTYALPEFSFASFDVAEALIAALNNPELVLGGLEGFFDGLDAVADGIDLIELPLIGGSAFDDLAASIRDVRAAVLGEIGSDGEYAAGSLGDWLQGRIGSDDPAIFEALLDMVRQELYQGLSPLDDPMFSFVVADRAADGSLQYDDNGNLLTRRPASADDIELTLTADGELVFGIKFAGVLVDGALPVDFSAGIPGLNLAVDAELQAHIGYLMGIGLGISADGVFLDTSGINAAGEEVALDVDASLAPHSSASGTLGFLNMRVSTDDAHGNLLGDTGVHGHFGLDITHDWALDLNAAATAQADLGVVVDVGGAAFPSVSAELSIDWDLLHGSDDPHIAFDHVTLDLGSFISDFVRPILDTIGVVLDPIMPLVDALVMPLPVVTELIDTVGGMGGLPDVDALADGEDGISLYDLASTIQNVKPNPKLGFVLAAIDVIRLIDKLQDVGDTVAIDLGSFELESAPATAGQPPKLDMTAHAADTTAQLNQPGAGAGAKSFMKSALSAANQALKFPILSDPIQLFKLLTGDDADATLFLFDMPALDFDFSLGAAFPLFPPFLKVTLEGDFAAFADFDFGFDTFGLRRYRESGDVADIFQGFFLSDHIAADGTDSPELRLSAGLTAGAVVDAVVFRGGVTGGIQGVVTADFHDIDPDGDLPYLQADGRIRPYELGQLFAYSPFAVFDIAGKVTYSLDATAKVGIFVDLGPLGSIEETIFEDSYNLASGTLLDFNLVTFPTQTPALAELDANGDLLLNIGDRAGRRLYGNTSDGDETFNISFVRGDLTNSRTDDDQDQILVAGMGFAQGFNASQVRRIVGYGGAGNDTIVVDPSVLAAIELHGGDGDDTLRAGGGASVLFGDAGDDLLQGGSAADVLDGGDGNDVLRGGAGNDTMSGGAGNDTMSGDAGADTMNGGAGNDALEGGDGNDGLDGGDGDDLLTGEKGADVLTGGAGADRLDGGLGADALHGDLTDVFLLGGSGNDFIEALDAAAASAPTLINGGDGNDTVRVAYGAAAVQGGAGSNTLEIFAPTAAAATLALNGAGAGAGSLAIDGAGTVAFAGFEKMVTLTLGAGADALTVLGTPETPTTILTGGGNDGVAVQSLSGALVLDLGEGDDQVTLGSNGSLAGLSDALTLRGGGGADRLVYDNSADVEDRIGSKAISVLADTVSGLPTDVDAAVSFDAGVETVELRMGSGADSVVLPDLFRQVIVNGGGGADSVDATLLGTPDPAALGKRVVTQAVESVSFLNTDTAAVTTQWVLENDTLRVGERVMLETHGALTTSIALSDAVGGTDRVQVLNVLSATAIDLRRGNGIVEVGQPSVTGLVQRALDDVAAPLSLTSSGPSSLTLWDSERVSVEQTGAIGAGLVTGFGMGAAGRIAFSGFASLAVNAQDDSRYRITIADTAIPTELTVGTGADTITVVDVHAATTLTLGGGDDNVTVIGAAAPLTVQGEAGRDALTFSATSRTTPVSAAVTAAKLSVAGIAPSIALEGVEAVTLDLGASQDSVSIDTQLDVTVHGGGGNDAVLLTRAAGTTFVDGGSGEDTLTVAISGDPRSLAQGDLASKLSFAIEKVIVDNHANIHAGAYQWRMGDGMLALGSTNLLRIDGADEIRVLAGIGSDTLQVKEDTASVDAAINGDRVDVVRGSVVLQHADLNDALAAQSTFQGLTAPQSVAVAAGATAGESYLYVRDATGALNVLRDGGDGLQALQLIDAANAALGGSATSINDVALSPDSQYLYTSTSAQNRIAVFKREADGTLALVAIQVLTDGQGGVNGLAGVTSLAVSADGYLYAAGTADSAVSIFSIGADGALSLVQTVTSPASRLAGVARVQLSADGARLYATAAGGNISVFDRATGGGLIFDYAFGPGGLQLATADASLETNNLAVLATPLAKAASGTAVSVSSSIGIAGDRDFFRLEAAPGNSVSITVNKAASGGLGDPFVRLLDRNGNQLALNDNVGGFNNNSLLTFSGFSYAGDYYIVVEGAGGSTGAYTVTSTLTFSGATAEANSATNGSISSTEALRLGPAAGTGVFTATVTGALTDSLGPVQSLTGQVQENVQAWWDPRRENNFNDENLSDLRIDNATDGQVGQLLTDVQIANVFTGVSWWLNHNYDPNGNFDPNLNDVALIGAEVSDGQTNAVYQASLPDAKLTTSLNLVNLVTKNGTDLRVELFSNGTQTFSQTFNRGANVNKTPILGIPMAGVNADRIVITLLGNSTNRATSAFFALGELQITGQPLTADADYYKVDTEVGDSFALSTTAGNAQLVDSNGNAVFGAVTASGQHYIRVADSSPGDPAANYTLTTTLTKPALQLATAITSPAVLAEVKVNGTGTNPDKRFLYVGGDSASGNTLQVLDVSQTQARPQVIQTLSGLGKVNSVDVSADGLRVYIAHKTAAGQDRIAVYTRNADGTLTLPANSDFATFTDTQGHGFALGAPLVVTPDAGVRDDRLYVSNGDGKSVYALLRSTSTTTVAALSFQSKLANGDLSVAPLDELRSVTVSGDRIYGLAPDDDVLVVLNAADLSIVQTLRDGNGGLDGLKGANRLAAAAGFVFVAAPGDGSLTVFKEISGGLQFASKLSFTGSVDALLATADGLLVAHGSTITRYSVSAAGVLSAPLDLPALPAGTRISDMEISSGRLIATDSLGGRLLVLSQIGAAATVTSIGGLNGAAGVEVSGDGKFAYVASTAGAVHVVDLAASSVVQTMREGSAGVRGIRGASSLTLSGDGRYLFVAGAASEALAVFQRDAASGQLLEVQLLRNRPDLGLTQLNSADVGSVGATEAVFVGSSDGASSFERQAVIAQPARYSVTFASMDALEVTTGVYDDSIRLVNPSSAAATTIDTGDGDDTVTLVRLGVATTVNGGAGNDVIDLRAADASTTLTVNAGAGDDLILVARTGAGSQVTLSGNEGDDIFQIAGSRLGSTVSVDGGAQGAADTLRIDSAGLQITPSTPVTPNGSVQVLGNAFQISYSSIENIPDFHAAVVDAGDYTITEGDGLTISAAVTPAIVAGQNVAVTEYLWDVNGDGVFGEVIGAQATLSWADLAGFGLDDGDTVRTIAFRAIDANGNFADDLASVTILNRAPDITAAGSAATVEVGGAFAVLLDASDPGADLIAQWTINWGDGTSSALGSDAAGAAHQHAYATTGDFDILVTAQDEDGSYTSSLNLHVDPAQPQIVAPRIHEGEGVTLRAEAAGDATIVWSLDGRVGAQITLTWAELEALGINDDGLYSISARALYTDAGSGQVSASAATVAQLEVVNVAPSAVFGASANVLSEGGSARVAFTQQADPSAPDRAALRYSYDFDNDGTFELAGVTAADVAVPDDFLADEGRLVVRAVVSDGEGSSTYFTALTVRNVAPALADLAVTPVTENGIATLTGRVIDPGVNDSSTVTVDWGDGSAAETVSLLDAIHRYLDDGDYTVSVFAADGDGGSAVATTLAQVANAAPQISDLQLTSSLDEGGTATLSAALADIGSLDSFVASVDWGDGSDLETIALPAGAAALTLSHVYRDDGQYAVTLNVEDKDGGAAFAQSGVSVGNVAAALDGVSVTSVDEGGAAQLSATIVDAGTADSFTVAVNWGDGSEVQILRLNADAGGATAFGATHHYLDDPAGPDDRYAVTISVLDDDSAAPGPLGSSTVSATVRNVAPTLTYSTGIDPVTHEGILVTSYVEGDTMQLAGKVVDAGILDAQTVTVNWGDGSAAQEISLAPGAASFNAAHRYLENGAYTVSLAATDGDGGSAASSFGIAVSNDAPVIDALTVTPAIDENGIAALSGTFSDAGILDAHTVLIDWADGGTSTLSLAAGVTAFSVAHRYLDDNPTGTPADVQAVNVRVLDDDGGESTPQSAEVLVRNVAPALTGLSIVPGTPPVPGSGVLIGTFSDTGSLDAHVVTVDWGDGTTTQTALAAGARGFQINHQYTTGDLFTIRTTLTDDDGGTSQASIGNDPIATSLAHVEADGTLVLHIGSLAGMRRAGNVEDGDESFTVRHVSGTAGNETLMVSAFGQERQYAGVRTIVGQGGDGNDSILLQSGVLASSQLWGDHKDKLGLAGNDVLQGGDGDDVLIGGLGNDTLYGQGGHDILLGDMGVIVGGKDVLLTDVATVTGQMALNGSGMPAANAATVNALLNADVVLLAGLNGNTETSRAVLLDLAADGNDTLSGGDGDDWIFGQRGNDNLNGDAGNDLLSGGAGDDRLDGGAGNDTVVGDDVTVDSPTATFGNVMHGYLVDGVAIVPAMQVAPGDTPNAAAAALAQIFGNPVLPAPATLTVGGVGHTAYASIITDFAHHLGQVNGNDTLLGGAGDDTLVGDDQVVVSRTVTFDAAAVARTEALTRALLDITDDFSDLVHDQYRQLDSRWWDSDHDWWDNHDVVVDNVFTVGADSLDGGAGNDVLIGDDSVLAETTFTLQVGYADDFERFTEGAADAADEASNAVLDLMQLDLHLRDQTVQVRHGSHWDTDVVHHIDLVAIGNDTLNGGDGNDLMIGDAFTTRTATVNLVNGGTVPNPSDDDAWKNADWNDGYRCHWSEHDFDDDWQEYWHFAAVSSSQDTIYGGAGNDLAWGDSLALLSTEVTRGSGISNSAYSHAGQDAADALCSLVTLTDSADYWLALQDGGHCDNDYADTIAGGDGDDILFGQAGNDKLKGENGADWLVGGAGSDSLDGGAGSDHESSGNDNSSSLRSSVAARLINWKDSFKNFGVPFTPFGGLKPVKYGGSGPGSFDFLEIDD